MAVKIEVLFGASLCNFSLLIIIIIQSAKTASIATAAASTVTATIAKPKCNDSCGSISIPYPFGIGEGCYMDKWFEIDCNETSNPPRAFIRRIKLEVLDINLEENLALVLGPIMDSNCSGRNYSSGKPVDLTGSSLFFSDANVFTAAGCNTRALMTNNNTPELIGCESTCKGTRKDVNRQEMLSKLITNDSKGNWKLNYSCTGENCCQIGIPSSSVQVFNPSLQAKEGNQQDTTDGCKLAFLASYYYDSTLSGIQLHHSVIMQNAYETVPILLTWFIKYSLLKHNDNTTLYCIGGNGESSNQNELQCACRGGFVLSPDLNCIDVDECKDLRIKHECQGITKCVNKYGSYKCLPDPKWIIIFVVVGVIGVLALLFGTWCVYKLVMKRRKIELKKKFFKRNGGLLLQQQLNSSDGSVQKTKIFTSKELEKATDRFNKNRILGQGGQGTVYKGMLADGRIVAVKKSILVDEGKLQEFINEVVILSQINHRYVVRLLGCCLETDVPLLVYEFIPNGSLFQYLHDQNEEVQLSWEMRLRIASEAAGAIAYLHYAAFIPIYHRDIKSTNILLDEKLRAKVSDFGTSRSITIDQTHLTTNVQGTFGYLDPEYYQSSQFTEKSDVYSFGVVLVELLSGQKPISWERSEESRSLATYFILMMEENRLFDIIDVRIIDHSHEKDIIAVANLARRCLNLSGRKRPTMKEVAIELEGIRSSRKDQLIVEENTEEIEDIMLEAKPISDSVSASVTSDFKNGKALSLDVEPLISYQTW